MSPKEFRDRRRRFGLTCPRSILRRAMCSIIRNSKRPGSGLAGNKRKATGTCGKPRAIWALVIDIHLAAQVGAGWFRGGMGMATGVNLNADMVEGCGAYDVVCG